MWIPLGDIPIEQGTLMVCPGTHISKNFSKLHQTYGKLDVDLDVPSDPHASGHLTNNPLTWRPKKGHKITWNDKLVAKSVSEKKRQHWVTEDFAMGDCVVFCHKTLHMSTTNTTDRFRISCDTRWQPAGTPIDERWRGGPDTGVDKRLFCGDKPIPKS